MKVRLHGIQNLDFDTKEGDTIKGTNLYISFEEDGIVGEKTDKLFLKDGFACPPVKPNDVLDVEYNNKGKAVSITVVSK